MDHSTDPPTRVFESGSILLYLAQRFGAFLPEDPRARTETVSWLFWQMGAAPYLGGGFGHFYSYAPTKRGLLGLADEPTLVAHQQVLHELLRDGRAALDHPARAQVGPRRPAGPRTGAPRRRRRSHHRARPGRGTPGAACSPR
jgi:glutathione S-transferase